MNRQLLRNSLKLAVASLITAALAVHFERIQFVYYPLMAVIFTVDDNDDQTLKAASSRVLGTVAGGLLTFWVHTIASGWSGVLITLLAMVPLLRILGWNGGLSTAALLCVMFLMVPEYSKLNWDYAFNRTLDTALGCVVALVVGFIFWPRNRQQELLQIEAGLRKGLLTQLGLYRDWLDGHSQSPAPLEPAKLSLDLIRMQQLVTLELQGPRRPKNQNQRWHQRLMLWKQVGHHWVQWERFLVNVNLPNQLNKTYAATPLASGIERMCAALTVPRTATSSSVPAISWPAMATELNLPQLLILALAEEQRPLEASLSSLAGRAKSSDGRAENR